jgi:hypothetical protein
VKVTRTPGTRGVVHIRADNQQELCRMFVRPQEFYESPYLEIRGQYFTLDRFKARYAVDHDGVFTYFDDWHGFHIPGHVLLEFFSIFSHAMSSGENFIEFATRGMNPFYLIGSHDGNDAEDALDHELVHATYYLNDWYRANADRLVKKFRAAPECVALEVYLKTQGYADVTLVDELNAYMATTDETWWAEELKDPALASKLYVAGAPFRALAADYNTKNRWL